METHVDTSDNTSIIIIDENQLLGIENEKFQTLVQNSIEQGSKNILVDLSHVKFISSWGIEGFLHAYKTCSNNNVNFNLKNVNVAIKNVLSKLKLNDIFNIA
jgi:anti-anti-sigma factor